MEIAIRDVLQPTGKGSKEIGSLTLESFRMQSICHDNRGTQERETSQTIQPEGLDRVLGRLRILEYVPRLEPSYEQGCDNARRHF